MIKKLLSTTSVALLLGTCLASQPAFSADTFYKWVDENGVTHYTPTPPPEAEVQKVKTFTGRSSDAGEEQEESDKEENSEETEEGKETSKKKASTKDPQACKQARDQLERAKRASIVREKDEDGNVKTRNKEEMLREIRERIKKFC